MSLCVGELIAKKGTKTNARCKRWNKISSKHSNGSMGDVSHDSKLQCLLQHICATNCYVAHLAHYKRIYIRTFKFDLLLHSDNQPTRLGRAVRLISMANRFSATVLPSLFVFLEKLFSVIFLLHSEYDLMWEKEKPERNEMIRIVINLNAKIVFICSKEPERERA